jgi:hypothetical protein
MKFKNLKNIFEIDCEALGALFPQILDPTPQLRLLSAANT